MKNTVIVKDKDEWSALAEFIGNIVAKYADVIDFDSLPDPDLYLLKRDITNTANERIKVEEHGVTREFIEKFSHYIANNVSKAFNKVENLLEADTDTLRISIVHESSAISGRSVCIRKTLPTVRMTVSA